MLLAFQSVEARVAAKRGAMIRGIPPLQRNKEPCTHLVEVLVFPALAG